MVPRSSGGSWNSSNKALQYMLLGRIHHFRTSDFPFSMKEICNLFHQSYWMVRRSMIGGIWLWHQYTSGPLDLVKYNDVIVGCKHFINKYLCCFWVTVTDMSNRQWELPWLKSLNSVVRVSSEIMRFVGAHRSYELLKTSLLLSLSLWFILLPFSSHTIVHQSTNFSWSLGALNFNSHSPFLSHYTVFLYYQDLIPEFS